MGAKAWLRSICLVALSFGLGWTASAWRFGLPVSPPRHEPGPPPLPTIDLLERLHLDAEQAKEIEEIVRDGNQREIGLREQVERARAGLEEAIDRTREIERLRERYAALMSAKNELERNHFETMMRIHAVLTMDQIRALRRTRSGKPPHRSE